LVYYYSRRARKKYGSKDPPLTGEEEDLAGESVDEESLESGGDGDGIDDGECDSDSN
jgi:hypothetical protein